MQINSTVLPGVVKYGGPWISQLRRDGLVNRSLFASQMGLSLESTIFLSNSTFCHGCLCWWWSICISQHGSQWAQKGATSAYCFSVFQSVLLLSLQSLPSETPSGHKRSKYGVPVPFPHRLGPRCWAISSPFGHLTSPSKRWSPGSLTAWHFPVFTECWTLEGQLTWQILVVKIFSFEDCLIYWASFCRKILSRKPILKFPFLPQMGCLNKILFRGANTEE